MRILWLPVALAGIVALVIASLSGGEPARAVEALQNGGFEVWGPSAPAEWAATGIVAEVTSPAISGSAASLSGSSTLVQYVEAAPGQDYSATVQVAASSGSVRAEVALLFLDESLDALGPETTSSQVLGSSFVTLSAGSTAPAGAAYVGVRLVSDPLSADGVAVFDEASLDVSDSATLEPTATFTATPTQTATNTPTPRPSRSPTSGSGGGGGNTPPPGECLSLPGNDPSELLANPGFEFALEGLPCAWDNFGGVMGWDAQAGTGGDGAASLISQTESTKWLYQVVPVEGGKWYEATASGRLTSGTAELWIGLLWYVSADGSGENAGSAESDPSAAAPWSELRTGPVKAPPGAHSVRFRLMLRSPFPASASFDDASLREVDEPELGSIVHIPGLAADGAGSPALQVRMPAPAHGLPPATTVHVQGAPACDICIVELMPDPAEPGRDASFEWVELLNRSSVPVDLDGWSIGDTASMDSLGRAALEPGDRLIIAGSDATFGPDAAVLRVNDGQIGSGLNNQGDTVRLTGPDGAAADSVTFGDGSPIVAPPSGSSIAWDDTAERWRISAPTPGEPPVPLRSLRLAGGDASEPDVAQLPVTPGGARTNVAPWLALGACVALLVFSAPFALERFRQRGDSRGRHAR